MRYPNDQQQNVGMGGTMPAGVLGTFTSPPHETEIQQRINELGQLTDRFRDIASRIEAQLGPVLKPDMKAEGKNTATPRPILSPLGAQLDDLCAHLDATASHINATLDRVAL